MSLVATAAYQALALAMLDTQPVCVGDDRFTDDATDHDAELAEKCAICPLRSACGAYAQVDRPAGFWGGQRWKRAYARREEE